MAEETTTSIYYAFTAAYDTMATSPIPPPHCH